VLADALSLKLASGANLPATVTASIVRRVAAAMAPCTRGELLARASLALNGCIGESPRDLLHEVVDDLIVGGDLDEQPALLEGRDDAPLLVFSRQPSFYRTGARIHLVGAAPDDAPWLPRILMQDVWSDGGLRYLVDEPDESDESMCDVLSRMGLHEISIDNWAAVPSTRSPHQLLEQVGAMLDSRGREEMLVGVRWLTSTDQSLTYRERWCESTNEHGLLIARAPQPYGADAWYVAARTQVRSRFLQLPLEEFPEDRACDLAWRVQLALDVVACRPSCYSVSVDGDVAKVAVDFPVPLRERRALLHLGGRRDAAASAFRFVLPASSLPAVEVILRGANFLPAGCPA
jgi:hypothetical protein